MLRASSRSKTMKLRQQATSAMTLVCLPTLLFGVFALDLSLLFCPLLASSLSYCMKLLGSNVGEGLQLRTTKRVLKSNEECRVSNHPLADDQEKERFIVRRRESLNYLSCDRDFSLTYHFFFRYTRTFWYLLGFLGFEGCWRYKDEIEAPAILSVKDCDGTSLSPNVARRTLGVRLAPDGNNEDEVKHLRGVAEKWKDHIRTGHLNDTKLGTR